MKTASKLRLVLSASMLSATLLSSLFTGCLAVAAGAAGAGTVAYVRGELDATLEANYDRAVNATNAAIAQLQFAKISEKRDALTAILVARTAADRKISIKVLRVGDQNSRVEIRVGFFGDEALSLTILNKIKANL